MEFNITFGQAKTRVDDFVSYMQSQGYKKSTQKIAAQNVKLFLCSATEDAQQLTVDCIFEFVTRRYDQSSQRSRFNSVLGSCRRFFSFLCEGNFDLARPMVDPVHLPKEFEACIETFIVEHSTANCEFTLARKQKAITKFALYLSECGINSFDALDGALIMAYLREKTPETCAYIRSFVRYLFLKRLITRDYSALINITKRPRKLPTIYSEEEICALISAVDGDSLVAKRDRAIILIAATTGMRSSDIVRLKYSDFCFEKGCVDIVQIKTGVPVSLPLSEETVSAVLDYYACRPSSSFENLFINQNAPFNPVSTGIIRYVLRNAFAVANIDVVGKKHGPHSLRSSLASAMVNSGIPYEVVQHQLGHTSDDSLRSYVKFDIEKLRICSMESQPATGNFKRWLEECV